MDKFIVHKSVWDDFTSYNFMEKSGEGHAMLYVYHNTPKDAILCDLHVSESVRKTGLGTKLQDGRERLALELGCTKASLWITKGKWQRKWYDRRGYKYGGKGPYEGTMWLVKKLN